jgi:hypothetical protein
MKTDIALTLNDSSLSLKEKPMTLEEAQIAWLQADTKYKIFLVENLKIIEFEEEEHSEQLEAAIPTILH